MPAARPAPADAGAWLPLGQASRLVGVDPGTLRRWADDGRVTVLLTPGGHRRFERRSLARLVHPARPGSAGASSLGVTPERLAAAYRRSYRSARSAEGRDARAAVAEADRDGFRERGRALVAALVGHLDATDPRSRAATLEEAAAVARDLGARLGAGGIDVTRAVRLFVAARRPFLAELGALARRRIHDPAQLTRLYEHASDALDRCLLAFIDAHRSASPVLDG
jgi:hypothetical protein